MLIAKVTAGRGLVRVAGTVPNGGLVVQRKSASVPTITLRNGVQNVVTGGFALEDSEPPIGVPVTYVATSTPTDRLVQRNLVLTPDFSRGLQSWTAGVGRTITSSGSVSPAASNAIIAEVGTAPLLAGAKYLISGKVRFRTPAVWTWLDVRNVGTWAQVKAAKANWAAVRSTATVPDGDSFAALWIQFAHPPGLGGATFTAPLRVVYTSFNDTNKWVSFSAWVTIPAGMPSTARLRMLHGSSSRELAITWDFDKMSIFSEEDANKVYRLEWFSGDSVKPARPQDYLMQNSEWEAVLTDALISWEGTPGNSVSRFIANSKISTSITVTLQPPVLSLCEPVLLSDPVSSALVQWFSLAKIDSLSREGRVTVMSVLGRSDFVTTSTTRSSAKGEITLYTNTLAERAQALRLFETGRVLLLRNPNPAYPETSWYISCGDITESRTIDQDARRPERTWTVPFVQVERPTGLIEASTGVTWQMIKDSGMTWGQLRDRYENWLEVALVEP